MFQCVLLIIIFPHFILHFSHYLGCDSKTMFQVVHQHFIATDDDRLKAVILSTYMKFINLFDDLAPIIITIFDHYRY